MADPKTWIDVAMAAVPVLGEIGKVGLPVIGTLGGTWLGAWWQKRQAEANNAHALAMARQQQDAARQQAVDDRREQQREQLLEQATAFYRNGRQMVGASMLGLMNRGQRYERLREGHRWSVVEPPENIDALTAATFEPVAALLVLAQDPSLRAPVVAFEDAMNTVPPAVVEMQTALRASAESRFTNPDAQSAFENAYDKGQAGLTAAEQALQDFLAAARDLLGVRLAPPEQATPHASDAPAALPLAE